MEVKDDSRDVEAVSTTLATFPPLPSASTTAPSPPPHRSSDEATDTDLDEEDAAWLTRLRTTRRSRLPWSSTSLPQSLSALTSYKPTAAAACFFISSLVILVALISYFQTQHVYPQNYLPPNIACSSPLSTSYAAEGPLSLEALSSTDALPDEVANNLHLTHAQCDAAFPLLWPRVMAVQENVTLAGGVRREDVERAAGDDGTRVAVIGGELFVKRFNKEYMSRVEAELAGLWQAIITSPEPLPDVDLYLRMKDSGYPGNHFELDVRESDRYRSWLLPDFGFFSWPEPILKSYQGVRKEILDIESSTPFTSKAKKLFWRGALLSPLRVSLKGIADQNPTWGDVEPIEWGSHAKGRVQMWDHCKHAFLAHVEGNNAYSGRLKYLLNCKSVVIAPRLEWYQHFHDAFDSDPNSPNQNIVLLPTSAWDDLPATMESLLSNLTRAEEIAENSWRTLRGRYLTPAATACYWRRTIKEYASTQQFTPTADGGTDYESFLLMGKTEWDPHR